MLLAAAGSAVAVPQVLPLVPNRAGPLKNNHHDLLPEPLRNSACYQNSEGQYINGNSGDLIKYPCNSVLDIISQCNEEYGNKDVEKQKTCFLGEGSSFETDYQCCQKCRHINGDASMDDAKDFLTDLREKWFNNKAETRFYNEIAPTLRRTITPVGIEPTRAISAAGVASINIHEYCPEPQLPQVVGHQKGDSAPDSSASLEKATALNQPAADATVSVAAQPPRFKEVEVSFYEWNKFETSNSTAMVLMLVNCTVRSCFTCSSPNQTLESRNANIRASKEGATITVNNEAPVPGTAKPVEVYKRQFKSGFNASSIPALQCGCLGPVIDGLRPTNLAAFGGESKALSGTKVPQGPRRGSAPQVQASAPQDSNQRVPVAAVPAKDEIEACA